MGDNTEDILFKCIKKYEEIIRNNYTYKLDGGIILKIIFKKSNFAHLLGLHKLTDIDIFQSLSDKDGNIKKGQAEIIYRKIKRKEIKFSDIINSDKFYLVENRIKSFLEIDDMLLFSEVIVNFNSKKLKIETNMDTSLKSNIIFFKNLGNKYIHLCIVNKNNETYPESFFVRTDKNYIKGQTKKLILERNIEPYENNICDKNGHKSRKRKFKEIINKKAI